MARLKRPLNTGFLKQTTTTRGDCTPRRRNHRGVGDDVPPRLLVQVSCRVRSVVPDVDSTGPDQVPFTGISCPVRVHGGYRALHPGKDLPASGADVGCLGTGTPPDVSERERARYDVGSDGGAAPETAFTSGKRMRRMTEKWRKSHIFRENIGAEGPLERIPRDRANRYFGPMFGLDLYCHLEK